VSGPTSAESGPAAEIPAQIRSARERLGHSLEVEGELLGELIGVLRGQRQGVAEDDLEAVDRSIHASHRLLMTLGTARKHRRDLIRVLTGDPEHPLATLPERLEPPDPHLRSQVQALRTRARIVSAELELNRTILNEALESGGEELRALLGGEGNDELYGSRAQGGRSGPPPGRIFNRTI